MSSNEGPITQCVCPEESKTNAKIGGRLKGEQIGHGMPDSDLWSTRNKYGRKCMRRKTKLATRNFVQKRFGPTREQSKPNR